MALQNIKYRRENPHSYPALADVAAQQERLGHWGTAAESWGRAALVARNEHNKHWARGRRDFCLEMAKRGHAA